MTEEKAIHEYSEMQGMENHTELHHLPSGIISFADYDAMVEAQEEAVKVKNDASLFKAMVDNILEIEPDEGIDKAQMIVALSQEFSKRVQQPPEMDSHLKEVYEDDANAIEADFGGGCPHCGFSIIKELNECPYCHNELT